MATNKLIKFGTWDQAANNTYTDDELVALAATGTGLTKQGIELGSIAYSDILNGLMRQITHTNKAFSDLVTLKANTNIDTSVSLANYQNAIELAVENIAKEVTVTKLTAAPTVGGSVITADATKSGITVSTSGLVKQIATLALTDLPSIATGTFIGNTSGSAATPTAITAANVRTAISAVPTARTVAGNALSADVTRDSLIGVSTAGFVKRSSTANTYTTASKVAISELADIGTATFLGRTDASSGAVSAITAANVLTAISGVPTSRTIAGQTLAANRSLDDILGVSSNGFVTRTAANTLTIDSTSYTPTARTIAGLDLTANRSRDNIIGITTGTGVVTRTAANTYAISTDYALDADVAKKDTTSYTGSISSADPIIWVGSETDYNTISSNGELDSSVVYIIT